MQRRSIIGQTWSLHETTAAVTTAGDFGRVTAGAVVSFGVGASALSAPAPHTTPAANIAEAVFRNEAMTS
jgi:hypothetical protein